MPEVYSVAVPVRTLWWGAQGLADGDQGGNDRLIYGNPGVSGGNNGVGWGAVGTLSVR